jgi:hypothetical protein
MGALSVANKTPRVERRRGLDRRSHAPPLLLMLQRAGTRSLGTGHQLSVLSHRLLIVIHNLLRQTNIGPNARRPACSSCMRLFCLWAVFLTGRLVCARFLPAHEYSRRRRAI